MGLNYFQFKVSDQTTLFVFSAIQLVCKIVSLRFYIALLDIVFVLVKLCLECMLFFKDISLEQTNTYILT